MAMPLNPKLQALLEALMWLSITFICLHWLVKP
jgi:hypothetical protein